VSSTLVPAERLPRDPAAGAARAGEAHAAPRGEAAAPERVRDLFQGPLARRALLAGALAFAVLTVLARLDMAPGKLARPEHILLRVVGDIFTLAVTGWAAMWLTTRFPLESVRGRRMGVLGAAVLGLAVAGASLQWLFFCVIYSRRCSRGFGPMVVDLMGTDRLEFAVVIVVIGYGLQYARRRASPTPGWRRSRRSCTRTSSSTRSTPSPR
jgi:hypothetical protein